MYLYNTPTRSKPGLHRRLDINSAIILRSRRKLSRHKTRKPGIVKRHIGRRRRRPRLGIPITIIYIAGSYTQSTTNDDRPHNRHPSRRRRNHSRTRNHLTGDLHDRHRRLFHHRGHRTNPAGTHLEVPHTLPEKIPGRKMARRVVGGQWVGVAVHIPVRRDPRRQRQTHTVPRDKPTGPRGVPAGLRRHLRRRRIRPRPLEADADVGAARGRRRPERVEHLLVGQACAVRGEGSDHIPVSIGQRHPIAPRRPQANQIAVRIPGVGRRAIRDRLLLHPGVAQRGAVPDREPIQAVIPVRRRPRRTVRHQPIKPVKRRGRRRPASGPSRPRPPRRIRIRRRPIGGQPVPLIKTGGGAAHRRPVAGPIPAVARRDVRRAGPRGQPVRPVIAEALTPRPRQRRRTQRFGQPIVVGVVAVGRRPQRPTRPGQRVRGRPPQVVVAETADRPTRRVGHRGQLVCVVIGQRPGATGGRTRRTGQIIPGVVPERGRAGAVGP